MDEKKQLYTALKTVQQAGKAVLEIYNSDYAIEHKEDDSPLTEADQKSHDIIKEALLKTEYPILSEEGKDIPYEERSQWEYFWLVDPLDGTKEFIKRNGEFTVNIALVHNQKPVLGVIYVPAQEVFYFATDSLGSFKWNGELPDSIEQLLEKARSLPLERQKKNGRVRVVASRSHINDPTQEYIDKLKKKYKEVDVVPKGSSLKLCLVAEGKAEVYPRFGPTMEWDTAAGQTIAEKAGCQVYESESEEPLLYNKKELTNPWFITKAEG